MRKSNRPILAPLSVSISSVSENGSPESIEVVRSTNSKLKIYFGEHRSDDEEYETASDSDFDSDSTLDSPSDNITENSSIVEEQPPPVKEKGLPPLPYLPGNNESRALLFHPRAFKALDMHRRLAARAKVVEAISAQKPWRPPLGQLASAAAAVAAANSSKHEENPEDEQVEPTPIVKPVVADELTIKKRTAQMGVLTLITYNNGWDIKLRELVLKEARIGDPEMKHIPTKTIDVIPPTPVASTSKEGYSFPNPTAPIVARATSSVSNSDDSLLPPFPAVRRSSVFSHTIPPNLPTSPTNTNFDDFSFTDNTPLLQRRLTRRRSSLAIGLPPMPDQNGNQAAPAAGPNGDANKMYETEHQFKTIVSGYDERLREIVMEAKQSGKKTHQRQPSRYNRPFDGNEREVEDEQDDQKSPRLKTSMNAMGHRRTPSSTMFTPLPAQANEDRTSRRGHSLSVSQSEAQAAITRATARSKSRHRVKLVPLTTDTEVPFVPGERRRSNAGLMRQRSSSRVRRSPSRNGRRSPSRSRGSIETIKEDFDDMRPVNSIEENESDERGRKSKREIVSDVAVKLKADLNRKREDVDKTELMEMQRSMSPEPLNPANETKSIISDVFDAFTRKPVVNDVNVEQMQRQSIIPNLGVLDALKRMSAIETTHLTQQVVHADDNSAQPSELSPPKQSYVIPNLGIVESLRRSHQAPSNSHSEDKSTQAQTHSPPKASYVIPNLGIVDSLKRSLASTTTTPEKHEKAVENAPTLSRQSSHASQTGTTASMLPTFGVLEAFKRSENPVEKGMSEATPVTMERQMSQGTSTRSPFAMSLKAQLEKKRISGS